MNVLKQELNQNKMWLSFYYLGVGSKYLTPIRMGTGGTCVTCNFRLWVHILTSPAVWTQNTFQRVLVPHCFPFLNFRMRIKVYQELKQKSPHKHSTFWILATSQAVAGTRGCETQGDQIPFHSFNKYLAFSLCWHLSCNPRDSAGTLC